MNTPLSTSTEHKKPKPQKIKSLRLSIVDMTSERFFQPTAQTTKHQQQFLSTEKRKSLFEIYKERNRRNRLARIQTDTTINSSLEGDDFGRHWKSNKKCSPSHKFDEGKTASRGNYQHFLDRQWNVETKLVLQRQKILDARIPCINIRKLTKTNIASKQQQLRRLRQTNHKLTTLRYRPPIIQHKPCAISFKRSLHQNNPQEQSLTPWFNPQVRNFQTEQLF